MKVPCPCCGYLTLTERGIFDICAVCFGRTMVRTMKTQMTCAGDRMSSTATPL
jgi:hypothetical protein